MKSEFKTSIFDRVASDLVGQEEPRLFFTRKLNRGIQVSLVGSQKIENRPRIIGAVFTSNGEFRV